jgi:hypothetical protein
VVTRVHARVLLDTGPDVAELEQIWRCFDDVGLTVDVQGHSYGGPPPTSMFLIVVNVPLIALLSQFATGAAHGAARLEQLVLELHSLRADARRWGRPHVLKFEDTHGILSINCPPGLSSDAYRALLRLDLTPFDRGSPAISCVWSDEFGCWRGHIDASPRPVWRALPTREAACGGETARPLEPVEFAALWRLVQTPDTSVITWQRAEVVLLSALGWNVSSIVAKTMLSSTMIIRVLHSFNRDGFVALSTDYHPVGPVGPDAVVEAAMPAARLVAATPPEQLGVPRQSWDARSLGEFLVGQAVLEDTSERWVSEQLLNDLPVRA